MEQGKHTATISRLEWGLGVLVTIIAVVAWGLNRHPLNGQLDSYGIFPLFGLIAFSIMWTHYVMWALRRIVGVEASKDRLYGRVSSNLVLALIIGHPLVLILALWRDGFGLPPMSYLTAYPGYDLAFICAILGLSLFLAYEFHRWFDNRSWWHWVLNLQLVAMIAIFYHSLTLGQEFAQPWFQTIWWFYGVTLLAAAVYNYWYDITHKVRGKYAKGE